MNSISTHFSIKDLENLSGIRAHTIRIWEKRYHILEPDRTDTNIRFYDISNLQKLLNVTLLYNNGHKISKIAEYENVELQNKVREEVAHSNSNEHHIDALKLSMLNFDQSLFEYTYNRMLSQYSFKAIFLEVFIPLLQDIGINWQSNAITPVHEHFISSLITQKLHLNIERIQQSTPSDQETTYVLFLPLNENHEFGLLYIHYELLLKGYKSIYLGQSVPLDNLYLLQKVFPNIHFISYFTVKPELDELESYLSKLDTEILRESKDRATILGRRTKDLDSKSLFNNITMFNDLSNLLNII